MRKRVEELFGEAKECMGLRRMKFRGALFVREQVLLTALAQNVKRMVRLLSGIGPKKRGGVLAEYRISFVLALYHDIRRASYRLCPTNRPTLACAT